MSEWKETGAGIWLGTVIAAVLLSACATLSQEYPPPPALLGQPTHEIPDSVFLSISAPMEHFVRSYAPADMHPSKRAWNLAYATLDPALMRFDYDPLVTLTAAETFDRGTGNCLSFSSMFISMARAAGLQAWFQEVVIPPNWTNVDETFLVSRHVNAVVRNNRSNIVVDVSGTARKEWLETKRISDEEARAQYFNNLGADALLRQDLPEAHAYFVKGIQTAPKTSYIWSNLAVVYNRNGQVEDAKSAYLTALDINSSETTALNNLHQLYLDEGDIERAEQVQSRVDDYRRDNPWYMHHLSVEAIEEKRYKDAVVLLQKAVRLNESEWRFHYALARAQLLAGDNQSAQKSLNRARQLAPADSAIKTASLDHMEPSPTAERN